MARSRKACWPDGTRPGPVLALLASLLTVSAASPRLDQILPTGGQRGTELELSLNGERLSDTAEVVHLGSGIEVLKLNAVTNKSVKAQVKLAPECRLGEHLFRLRTAAGISEWRTFFVGAFPVVNEVEPNNHATNAQPIPLNTTVAGRITSEDFDVFAVTARKGQRLSAEVEAMRLGRAAFDARLTLRDAEGRVLADCDDSWLALQDPLVSIVTPADGTYFLQVREAAYGGSEACVYRLHIGTFPRPTAAYPLGGKAGETLAVRFFSEATGEFTQEVKLPDAPQERLGVCAELEGVPSPSPNWVRVSAFPNVLEVPPNQDREHATFSVVAPPLALNGILGQPGESDWFRFHALKGQALEVSVWARRLRSPLDSVVEVFDAKGGAVASNDDASGPDSVLKFTPGESTNYFVRIRDTMGSGGREFTYRIEITPPAPALALKIPEVARNDTQTRQWLAVPRGNRSATLISARRANFGGELLFGAEGLPPGVTLLAERMPANVDAQPLVFEAAPDAPVAGRLLDLTATWTNAGSRVVGRFRQDIELVQGPNNTFYYGTSVDKLHVAVTKAAPFRLRIVEPQVPLVQAGSMRLEVVAERDPGFDEPITVQMVWNPPGVSAQSEATIPKGGTNVLYPLNAGAGAQPRVWKTAVLGGANVEGGLLHVSSQLAPLEVATPFVAGKIEPLALNPGQASNLVCRLEPLKPFEGKATVRLLGLPERVTTAEREITRADKEVAFPLTVATNCPFGSHKALVCAVEVPQAGQFIPHTIAAGGILRIVPPKRPETNVVAKAVETR